LYVGAFTSLRPKVYKIQVRPTHSGGDHGTRGSGLAKLKALRMRIKGWH